MNKFKIITLLGILFFLDNAYANLKIKLLNNDLKISGEFSFNENKPLIISGFDQSNRPYKLSVEVKKHDKKILRIMYSLDRNGKVEAGSMLKEKGRLASVHSSTDDKKEMDITFEALISE